MAEDSDDNPSLARQAAAGSLEGVKGAGPAPAAIAPEAGIGVGAGNAANGEQDHAAIAAFPIVGIGASAGGLEACKRLLQALPGDTGMAFVLIQHLHPDFPSHLAEILSRSTSMPVLEVHDEPVVRPNHVYVIPPARCMVIDGHSLRLHERSKIPNKHRPVNSFLRSLAGYHRDCAIGVLLSGTGSDGAQGMAEIKAEGGVTFAQDDSAQFDAMPRSAIDAGCVDFVLPPEGIAAELVRIGRHQSAMSPADDQAQQGDRAVDKVLRLARDDKHRLHPREISSAGLLPEAAARPTTLANPTSAPPQPVSSAAGREPLRDADRILLSQYTPPAVLVNAQMEIVQFRGDTSAFLLMGSGRPSLSLLKLARKGLLAGLRAALQRAAHGAVPVTETGNAVRSGGRLRRVDLEVVPVPGDDDDGRHYLVLFTEVDQTPPATLLAASDASGTDDHSGPQPGELRQDNARLAQELQVTRDYLHTLLEQRDEANQDLQSATEELQSSNEELQRTNQELQTSKQELESSIKQLVTVNEELSSGNERLDRVNSDLTNIMASTQIALVTVGPDLCIRWFTSVSKNVLNLLESDIGRPLGDLKVSFAVDDIEARLTDAMHGIKVPEIEIRDRSGRWYSMRARPYLTPDNRIDGAVLVFVDIDQQKQSEISLRHSQEKHRLLIDGATGIAILLLDMQGMFVGWNVGARRLFQYDEAQVLGKHVSMLYQATEADRPADELKMAAAKEFAIEESFMVRRDGSCFWASGVMTVLRDEEGGLRGYSKVISDVSDKHQAQEERRLAAERKDEFLAVLAHELRNPLAPMRTSLHLLENPDLSAQDAQHARDVMKRQVAQMVRLVDDLLDVARIAKGRIEYKPALVDLATVITTAVESARPLIDEARQHLRLRLPPEPMLLHADHTRLAQAVANLLVNASRYTPNGGHITLIAECRSQHCAIRVVDDGMGIAPDMQHGIFELFAQAGHLPERTRDGLGIGLSLVRALVDLHGGKVAVKSEGLGHGSEFSITLPRLKATPAAESPQVATTALPRGQRILVVDDNRDGADTMASILRLEGHTVYTAYDGNAGLEVATAQKPGIALLDIGLPGMDGFALCEQIRDTPWGEDMLLVAITGWGQDSDKRCAARAGFDAHLTKPIDPSQLLVQLKAITDKRARLH